MRTKNANELEPKFSVKSQNVSWYHIEKKQTMSDKVKHFDIIIIIFLFFYFIFFYFFFLFSLKAQILG